MCPETVVEPSMKDRVPNLHDTVSIVFSHHVIQMYNYT